MYRLQNFIQHARMFLVRREARIAAILLLALFALGGAFGWIVSPPHAFPVGEIVEIKEGETLRGASQTLADAEIIRSPYFFEVILRFSFSRGTVVAGEYRFAEPLTLWEIARRLSVGDFNIPRVFVRTLPGMTISDITEKLKKEIPEFDESRFALLAQGYEGFLFPDTYDFSVRVKPEEAVRAMTENFEKKTAHLDGEIALSGRSLAEIITMASIIEREAGTDETRKMVSGILWKRIEENIPLQVDAAFNYVNGKNTFELSLSDLRLDSPYNTYRFKGLPPTPIANPGLDSIDAALHPTPTDYLFYLSDREGEMHYAEDFDGHKKNKRKYLN